ncbi:MAG TPA: HD domain-containing phosphohydrolase [Nitrospiria bacterium]|nr:HD domain-containing phosphohydrolase [Nitrospiria bacterium]
MSKEKILIIDDEESIRQLCTAALISQDYQVRCASNGIEGLKMVGYESFDLILTDIMMPGMGGLQFIISLREVDAEIPIIVITGHGTVETAIESLKLGVQGFLMKPFTIKEFKEAVHDAFTKSRLVKENIRLRALLPLFETAKMLMSQMDLDQLLRTIVDTAIRGTKADRGSLMLIDEKRGELRIAASSGLPPELIASSREKIGEGIAGWVAEKGSPLIISDGSGLEPNLLESMRDGGISSALCVPLIIKEKVIGVLNLSKTRGEDQFTHSDQEMLSVLCGQAAIAIENARLYMRLEDSYLSTIIALSAAVEARDSYTVGHMHHISEYSTAIAKVLGLSSEEISDIRIAGLLHDLGKIGIPDNILLKPGKLDKTEYDIMKSHPTVGVRIIESIESLKSSSVIIGSHQEQYNGEGYPKGLKGKDIPLGARIVAVADAFDAMTTTRPYRKAMSYKEAFEEIKRYSGTQFDPEVVRCFTKVLKDRGLIAEE